MVYFANTQYIFSKIQWGIWTSLPVPLLGTPVVCMKMDSGRSTAAQTHMYLQCVSWISYRARVSAQLWLSRSLHKLRGASCISLFCMYSNIYCCMALYVIFYANIVMNKDEYQLYAWLHPDRQPAHLIATDMVISGPRQGVRWIKSGLGEFGATPSYLLPL